MRWRSSKAGRRNRRRVCASRCRSCRTSPISTISIRSTPSRRSISCACGRARRFPATPLSSCCPARRRRSPTSRFSAPPDSISTSPHTGAAAARSSGCAAATRCWGVRLPIPMELKACRESRRSWFARRRNEAVGRKASRTGARDDERRRAVCRLRDAYGRDRRAGLRAAVRAARRRLAGGRGLGRRPGGRHLYPRPLRR